MWSEIRCLKEQGSDNYFKLEDIKVNIENSKDLFLTMKKGLLYSDHDIPYLLFSSIFYDFLGLLAPHGIVLNFIYLTSTAQFSTQYILHRHDYNMANSKDGRLHGVPNMVAPVGFLFFCMEQ